jgi:magnesium chelatase family protein
VVQKYLNRISGPLLDRIDIHIEVTPVPINELTEDRNGEISEMVRERVITARNIQTDRYAESPGVHANAQMSSKQLKQVCQIDDAGRELLKTAADRLGLSARAFDRILKVSRTIADLEGVENIETQHLAEAIQYRSLDRDSWAG